MSAAERPPSVDSLAAGLSDIDLPHPLLVDAARQAIAALEPGSARDIARSMAAALLQPVINATGVLLHTNLGRAPLAPSLAVQSVRGSHLELDLATGRRGDRRSHAATLLARLIGAESALVVNNGAAAVLLVLSALAEGRTAVVSRGELVEIGGGFRIPDVMAFSGARLIEVGTTNRTRLADYQSAMHLNPALILKVHQSNYRISGFTEAAPVPELATIGPPVVADIGSGLLDSRAPWLEGGPPRWLADEPAARQTLADGAALVTFSGDKLLGGPQAGIIAGDGSLVDRCARHSLARALRPGTLVLAELQNTALSYLKGDGSAIPFWRMAVTRPEQLRQRAEAVGGGEVVPCRSLAGAGSLPGYEIPSWGIGLPGNHTATLRSFDPPVMARVRDGTTILDLRTVDPQDDVVIAKVVSQCM